jgi:uncharacterized protein
MILIDSNVPMYLVGADHPHKVDAQRELERLISDRQRLVTDAEAFQEILHRYVAIDRRDAIQSAFDVLRGVVDEVFPVAESDVVAAKDTAVGYPSLSARDALHVAVMRHHQISRVLTFDRGFDAVPGLQRLPART